MASAVRRAQRFMEMTGRKSIGGPSTKLGFDKSKVTCFKCKQKGHFKRECRNAYADDTDNPFREDYYKKAIYHQNKSEPPRKKQLEENSRALAVIHDDEGYGWSQVLPEKDCVGYAFVADFDHDLWWRRDYARWEIEKFREPFKEAQRAKRWNDELECYMDPQGNPVVDPSKIC
ncbi:putative transcription factor interactor and regulator CCHC(Zn) family [Helianthus debilis subsp. tardiflorus]